MAASAQQATAGSSTEASPPLDPLAIANEFVVLGRRDGAVDMTPMKLQKLVYLAHGWNLANFATPLISESVQAWRYGPVVPSLYHELKELGRESIVDPIEPAVSVGFWPPGEAPRVPFDRTDALAVVEAVWKHYGTLSPLQLSNLTHERGTPWSIVTREGEEIAPSPVISDELIARCFVGYMESGG